ncbi:MAG: trypsin-like peptidase domain-containing protein [Rhodanobacter sp.]
MSAGRVMVWHRFHGYAWSVRLACVTAFVLMAIGTVQAASLDPSLLPKIQAATFEVVAAKPVVDPLTYEKPLPLDLLPYQERNDKYHSIGTAFAIGHGRYVTAAHVLRIGFGSLWGEPALRDASGHVFAIDKIEKYSLRKDFVVFSLTTQPSTAALEIDTKPALNQVVYAVGNALGTGVIIRDGLYTSTTPEDQDGSWKWLRFSAAASPGNSGGPLLDSSGKLIGVVLMKSANENLNYALPISEVLDAPDRLAVIDQRLPYQFDVFDATLTGTFKAQFALPLSFADFSARFLQLEDAFVDQQLKALLTKESARLFPRGDGSHHLLDSVPSLENFPEVIVRNNSGEWGPAVKRGPKTTLSDNGYIAIGMAGHSLLFHLRKPDSVTAAQLYNDPAQLINQIAKVGVFKRKVGSEHVNITGLGKPSQDTLYMDTWKRHWQVRVWPLAFGNALVVTCSLPVPDGYVTLLQFAPAGDLHEHLTDMQALTDFVRVAYDGTLAQWKDYLQNTALLPTVFSNIQIDADYDHRFSYASKRLSFAFTPALQKITPNSKLTLGFGYFGAGAQRTWGVGNVQVAADANTPDRITIQRHVLPSSELDDSFKSGWDKVAQRQHPFEGVPYRMNDRLRVASVVGPPASAAPKLLYTAFYGAAGSRSPADLSAGLALLLKDLHVLEH